MAVCPPTHSHRAFRVFVFYSVALVLTGVVSLMFADLLWRTGWSTSRTVLLSLFIILFFLAAIGCTHGLFGFFLRRFGDRRSITQLAEHQNQSIAGTSTALIFPIYNEDVVRVIEGVRTTYESLEKTGHLERFDLFILSDSTDPDKWVEEERRWLELVRDLDALGRIYYRRRVNNEGKKSGNVRDFLNTWGRRYRYFVCFDADSIMRGETLVELVKLMEAHGDVGMIQTVPALINAESLFGRIQQFANRLYAPIFIAGLNFWSQGFGNYWGHNAIIRTEPFMHYCDLPQLPGRKPFGGQILSHDFVEAALMVRENWQVWMAYDLEGSYEEAPQGLIENAQRDRRWCQGNLQHALVLFAKGLRGLSRVHLLMGIFGYLAGPLWLAFLLTFHFMRWFHELSNLSDITVGSRYLHLSGTAHAFLIFVICMAVLMLPKLLALVDLAFDAKRRGAFGGLARSAAGVFWETLFSTFHAPLQMLWHTRFVITILLGIGVNWGTQKRAADGTAWFYALARHWGHVLVGLVWGALVWSLDQTMFWWFVPVLAGMVFSILLSVLTSRSSWGQRAKAMGLFLTPEETTPPSEIVSLRLRMAEREMAGETAIRAPDSGLADVVLNPYVNAVHVSLLREKRLNPDYAEALTKLGAGSDGVRSLGEKLLAAGPDALTATHKLQVLSDADTILWLHRRAWLRPSETFAPWWQKAIKRYGR